MVLYLQILNAWNHILFKVSASGLVLIFFFKFPQISATIFLQNISLSKKRVFELRNEKVFWSVWDLSFLTLLVGCREQIKDLKNAGLSERHSN